LGFERTLTMQASFSGLEYAAKKRVTRRDWFLSEIDAVTPWSARVAEIEPIYPKGDCRGRPLIGVQRMLRIYVAQQCFGLSDEGIEGTIYDSQTIRGFVGLDLNRETAPDATTLLKFRRLLETKKLTERIFTTINSLMAAKGLLVKDGTVVDATIIKAPAPTKSEDGARDPKMHQTRKDNQWHFGMKVQIGVDAGYQGVEKRQESQNRAVKWQVALRPGKRRALPDTKTGRLREQPEKPNACV